MDSRRVYILTALFLGHIMIGCSQAKPPQNTIDLKQKAQEAFSFCKKNKLDTTFCILIDMNIHSGKKRFFVWDFANKKIMNDGLCSHGCCDNPWGQAITPENPTFSNVPNSHCSSLGKYKIGKRNYSNWGIHINYVLHGMEKSNNNALKREIVLHSWEEVEELEIYPLGTPEGWGCPAISNKLMKEVDNKLKNTSTSVLLWVYK